MTTTPVKKSPFHVLSNGLHGMFLAGGIELIYFFFDFFNFFTKSQSLMYHMHSCSSSWSVSVFVVSLFRRFKWLFREELLFFPSRTCLHLTNSWSFAIDIFLSFCLGS